MMNELKTARILLAKGGKLSKQDRRTITTEIIRSDNLLYDNDTAFIEVTRWSDNASKKALRLRLGR